MITFKKVRFKNILSFGNMMTEIDLIRHPTTLVQGKNGGGKSAATLDSICYGLFGKPFRKINKPTLVNHKNKKDLLVELELDNGTDQYVIRRGMNPQIFEIIKNGELLNIDAAVKDYQVYLERYVLKFDYQVFTQLVMLGKATYVSFMRMDAGNRRKFIENILGLSIFSTMNEVHKKYVSDLKDTLGDVSSEIKILKEKISVRSRYIHDLEADSHNLKEARLNEIVTEVARIRALIDDLDAMKTDLQNQIQDVDADQRDRFQDKLERLYDLRSKMNMKIGQIAADMKFFQDNTSCPTCGQEIDDVLRDAKVQAISVRQDQLASTFTSLNNDITQITDTVDSINEQINSNAQLMRSVNDRQKQINGHLTRIGELEESKTFDVPNNDKIETEKALLDDFRVTYDDLLNRKADIMEKGEYFDLISSMLKDTGIKSMIIRKYIPIINATINNYLKQLGFFVKFVMDDNFEEKIYARGIDEQNYYNFSEGEKLRIDLAVLLAWRDIARMQNNLNTNLLVFDEILDGSIDNGGADAFIDLIQTMQDINIFVVSHSPDRWSDKFRGNLIFGKEGGFSKLLTQAS